MATTGAAKINIKNIDYFKFKKIVIDGNRDDYAGCSKEVKALCDSVQTLSFRDDEFDDVADRSRFDEIIGYYRQILTSKRIDPVDMRVKNGWWVDTNSGNVCSAGKFKATALKETLVAKTRDWMARRLQGTSSSSSSTTDLNDENVAEKIEGPGLYVFKHKEHQCFQYVGRADKIFSRCSEKLKQTFDGTLNEPLAALIVISMASDWDFYFIPVSGTDGPDLLRILENDVILKHDCIWPHGLNFSLHIDSLLEVSEFRKSCLRHRWPPETDVVDEPEINLARLRLVETAAAASNSSKSQTAAVPDHPRSNRDQGQGQGQGQDQGQGQGQSQEQVDSHVRRSSAVSTKGLQGRPNSAATTQSGTARPTSDATKNLPVTNRKMARPASAPKPPARQVVPPTVRPNSPRLSKSRRDGGLSQTNSAPTSRSLDISDHRSTKDIKAVRSSAAGGRPERPRSSLDVRHQFEPEVVEFRGDSQLDPTMIRSRSFTSTSSGEGKKENDSLLIFDDVKTTTTESEVIKPVEVKVKHHSQQKQSSKGKTSSSDKTSAAALVTRKPPAVGKIMKRNSLGGPLQDSKNF